MTPIDDDRIPAWRRYLRFARANPAADVEEELAFHFQSAIDEYLASGMSPSEARAAAQRKFGDVERITQSLYTLSKQRERKMAFSEKIAAFRQDLAYGARQLRKSPAFTIVAVLTLALGIGANSAIFSVVYSVLLQPLPYMHSDRIVTVSQLGGKDTISFMPFGNWHAWRTRSQDFEALGATWGLRNLTLTGNGDPVPVPVVLASADYFQAVHIPPVVGRYYNAEEDREGAPRVGVISYAMWQTRFNADPSVVGKTITVNSNPVMIVGVASPEYITTPPAERMWLPLAPEAWRLTDYEDHELRVYGLLKAGVSPGSAAAHLREIEMPIAREHPNSGYDGRIAVRMLSSTFAGDQKKNLYMLLGAVSLVLLIACVNIANLLMARAAVRRGEIAIRGALGASRPRIVAQMLAESLLLGLAGAIAGLGVAYVGMRFLITSPVSIPRLQSTTLNGPVVAFTLGLAVLSAIVFGLVPALRASRTDLQTTLREGGRDSRGASRDRLRGALVISELCLAQILLIGAGLLIRSGMNIQAVPPGFDTNNLLAVSVGLPRARYKELPQAEATLRQMEGSLAAIPGVKAVGFSQVAPIYGNGYNWTVFREGSNTHDEGATGADMRSISSAYFGALGQKLLRGRAFTNTDGPDAPKVAIISRGLAMKLFGSIDVVGRRISNGNLEHPDWREIVGVADDVHGNGLAEEPFPALYMPTQQFPQNNTTFVIRGNVPVTTLLPEIRRAIGAIDPLVPLSNVMTMDAAIGRHLAYSRFNSWLLGLLGGTGLVLAIIGVYGVVSYFVTQRSRELGVRLALGASDGSVRWLVVRQGLTLALIGVAVGVPLALAATRLLSSFMFGITPHDPLTFAAVAGLLSLVVIAASYIPARRATRIDPLEALRSS